MQVALHEERTAAPVVASLARRALGRPQPREKSDDNVEKI